MAGNFWQSSHYQQWILDRQDISKEKAIDLQKLSEEEYQKLMIFYANIIQALGEHLKVRQQVIATATVYFKRFYAKNSVKCIDPLLMAPTSVFLATKVEEFGLISHAKLVGACQIVVKNHNYAFQQAEYPFKISQILEAEFFLLEMMDCCLIVYHPYRQLMLLMQDIGNDEALMSFSWKIINDSLRSEVSLLYAPYQIALAALHIAAAVLNKDIKNWFAELSVDMDKIFEVVRIILGLYELWKQFDERKEMFGILQKMPKPNSQPSRPPSSLGNIKSERQD